jgi:microcystin-dependent protein
MTWTTPRTWVTGEIVTSAIMNTHVRDNLQAVAGVGSYQYVAAIAKSDGSENLWQGAWLECNGATVSRTTYANLFNYLNGLSTPLPFGSGDGSTTFTLPDFSGRSPIAMSGASGHADVKTIGNSDGNAVASRRPKHKHTTGDVGHAHRQDYELGSINAGTEHYVKNGGSHTDQNGNNATTGVTVGPQTGAEPIDSSAYLVGGIWVIKAIA